MMRRYWLGLLLLMPLGCGLREPVTGVCPNFGCNVPLNSTHASGVNAGFCDGTVQFLNNSVTLLTLAQIATRDDGIPTPSLD
jgi:prepilin-type processing-associated H-X9-DG protein